MRFLSLVLLSFILLTFGCGGGGGGAAVTDSSSSDNDALVADATKTNPWSSLTVTAKSDNKRTTADNKLKKWGKIASSTTIGKTPKSNKKNKTDTYVINETYNGNISGSYTVTGTLTAKSDNGHYPRENKYELVFNFNNYEDSDGDYGLHGEIHYSETETCTSKDAKSSTIKTNGGYLYKYGAFLYSVSFEETGVSTFAENDTETFTYYYNDIAFIGSYNSITHIYILDGVTVDALLFATYEEYDDDDDNGDGKFDLDDSDGDGEVDSADEDDDNDGSMDSADDDDNGDGEVDSEDLDDDNDGIMDTEDLDENGDGVVDSEDVDSDNDGIVDSEDLDDDNDGIPDTEDDDDDNDGIPDSEE